MQLQALQKQPASKIALDLGIKAGTYAKEVIELLGVSNSKLHQMRTKNLITYSSFGRNIYYSLDDIHLILEQNKVARIRT